VLNLQPTARLRISFIGFEPQVLYVNNRKQITVLLKTTQKAEDEVVITGYQKLRAWESVGFYCESKRRGYAHCRYSPG
jgi:hypothetical protein